MGVPPRGLVHNSSLPLSHPPPGPEVPPVGWSPTNPSMVAATRSTCEPQDATAAVSNVRSDIAYASARLHNEGSPPLWTWVRHAYCGAAQPATWSQPSIWPPLMAAAMSAVVWP